MKKVIILIIVILIGIASFVGLEYYSDYQARLSQSFVEEPETTSSESDVLSVSFSKNKTFYSENIEVELKANKDDAVIYYTTDGNDPTTSSKKYKSPIKISAKTKANATTVKAIAVTPDETSEICLKSYVTAKNIEERFDDETLIFVLSTDEYNLYDYYYGVATEGYKRDEYLNSDEYNGGEIPYNAPANWFIGGRESERDMYVEVYTPDGEQIISQAAGARVVGGVSRAVEQKSWRLIARNVYSDGNGKFKYAFFSGATDAYGNLLTRYDRITLRNNANDREFAAIRDELSMTLSSQAGFPDTQNVRPAAVFLNSEYYGFAWLHEAYSNDYLANNYGGNKDNFRIVGSKEQEVEGDDEQCVEDWNHLLEVAESGLTNLNNYKEFKELVDVDNLLMYYAIQLYVDNKDWPGNNFKAWRYYPSENEVVESEYLDGRWRFLLFDAEYAWGLYGNGYRDNTLTNVLTGNHMQGDSVLLKAVLERSDLREKFANIICDLIGGSFSPENANNVIDELIEISDKECMYALENGYTSTWAREETFADSRQQIREFAEKRPTVMLNALSERFDYDKEYFTVSFNNPTGAEGYLNTQKLRTSGILTGSYFSECKVPVSMNALDGYEFDYWEINGVRYDDRTVNLRSSMADDYGLITVSLHVKKIESHKSVYISELYTAGDGDWIEIYNPTDSDIKLDGFYLSDDELNLQRWKMPAVEIKAGEVFTVVCKNNSEKSALKKYQTNFSLKTGETLYFSDSDGNVVSSVAVVDMEETESLSRGLDGLYSIGAISEGVHFTG